MKSVSLRNVVLAGVLLFVCAPWLQVCQAQSESKIVEDSSSAMLFSKSKRVVFLGASITNAGQFINEIEVRDLVQRDFATERTLINLGLGSETCSGLSEPVHPFPRPNVHERLSRVLERAKPDLVIACYGINDGIYHPFSNDRFEAFKSGLQKVVDDVQASGSKIIVLTPLPFDPLPMSKTNKLQPADAKVFAWHSIYEKYDEEVMQKYAQWVMLNELGADAVINVYDPIKEFVEDKRKSDTEFVLSKDGIHIDGTGHRVMGDAISKELGLESVDWDDAQIKKVARLVSKRHAISHPSWLSHVGHKRPSVKPGKSREDAEKLEAEITTELATHSSE